MKISACILLVSLLAFVAETVKLPFPATENKKIEVNGCCRKKSMQEQACATRKQQNPKPDDCSKSVKCIDCPLCFVFSGQQLYSLPLQPNFINQEYSVLQIHGLEDYFNQQWKPPNMI